MQRASGAVWGRGVREMLEPRDPRGGWVLKDEDRGRQGPDRTGGPGPTGGGVSDRLMTVLQNLEGGSFTP